MSTPANPMMEYVRRLSVYLQRVRDRRQNRSEDSLAIMDGVLAEVSDSNGTSEFTPYLILRGWQFFSFGAMPGLEYVRDPVTGERILNLIGVSRQLVRDGLEEDPHGFSVAARRTAPLPEPLRTEIREAMRMVTEAIPQLAQQETLAQEREALEDSAVDMLRAIGGANLQVQFADPRTGRITNNVSQRVDARRITRRQAAAPPPEDSAPTKPAIPERSPLTRRFRFEDRE